MNAALSAMPKFYLAIALLLACCPGLAAQTVPKANEPRPPLGSTITVDALGELPASATVFGLLDTSFPDVISDRFDTGGLSAGDPARLGAHGSSWTQTRWKLGDADITDPGGNGTPLLSPGVVEWDRVTVATGFMPVDAGAPGMAVSLMPRRAASVLRSLDLFGSPSFLNAGDPAGTVPSIERLDNWVHANLVVGGPLVPDRIGAFLSAAWTRSSYFERGATTPLDANLASGFLTLEATPQASDRVRIVGWAQRTSDPFVSQAALGQPSAAARANALHTQAAWERQVNDTTGVRAFGSFTVRGRTDDLLPAPVITIERLRDGPVPALLDPGQGTDRVWSVGGRVHSAIEAIGGRHEIVAGVDFSGSSMTQQSAFTGRVGELVNGLPARIWDFTEPAGESAWHQTSFRAFAGDTVALFPRLTLNAGASVELLRAYQSDTADAPAISWQNVYPQAGLHYLLTNLWQIATFAQFGRYGHSLPLRDLAWGDPAAPTGNVYAWKGGNPALASSLGPLVQRVGPGSGSNPLFSAIDPDLRRPYMDEVTFGFESHPRPTALVRMVAIARREQPLIGVVDVGVPQSSYSTIGVPDPGLDLNSTADDQTLLFYNRSPSTFGADRYLLTNPADDVATFVGVDVTGEVHANRLFLIAGATAGRSEGVAANRGFGPLENDAASLGDVYIDPNSAGHAQGRLFTERGYTIKTAMAYQFEHELNVGLVGRYQDGQHFARLVVLPDLNQGTEFVRAFRNGRTRFTFSMTVDARVQKSFTIGERKFFAVLDAYNLFNQSLEVEELQVTGAGARMSSAFQPPRVLHVGVKIPF